MCIQFFAEAAYFLPFLLSLSSPSPPPLLPLFSALSANGCAESLSLPHVSSVWFQPRRSESAIERSVTTPTFESPTVLSRTHSHTHTLRHKHEFHCIPSGEPSESANLLASHRIDARPKPLSWLGRSRCRGSGDRAGTGQAIRCNRRSNDVRDSSRVNYSVIDGSVQCGK